MGEKLASELKVMHACELGATGVYRGHKCVARYFFRRTLNDLDHMRSHEINHADIFLRLIKERNYSPCFAYNVFFWGGLFYGVIVGVFGLKAIGTSTYTIESIVNNELNSSIINLSDEIEIIDILKKVQKEEIEHREAGKSLSHEPYFFERFIARIASLGAYAAKKLAQIL